VTDDYLENEMVILFRQSFQELPMLRQLLTGQRKDAILCGLKILILGAIPVAESRITIRNREFLWKNQHLCAILKANKEVVI